MEKRNQKATSFKNSLGMFFCSALVLNTSGCTTLQMLSEVTFEQKTTKKIITTDTVYAFATVNKRSRYLQRNSLVMIGDKYWYSLAPTDSKKYLRILRSGLSKPFMIADGEKSLAHNAYIGNMKLELTKNKGEFARYFCLKYTPESWIEKRKLNQLGFKIYRQGFYGKCMSVRGKYFEALPQIPIEYHFENPIYVKIEQKKKVRKYNEAEILFALALTPFTLAYDVLETLDYLKP